MDNQDKILLDVLSRLRIRLYHLGAVDLFPSDIEESVTGDPKPIAVAEAQQIINRIDVELEKGNITIHGDPLDQSARTARRDVMVWSGATLVVAFIDELPTKVPTIGFDDLSSGLIVAIMAIIQMYHLYSFRSIANRNKRALRSQISVIGVNVRQFEIQLRELREASDRIEKNYRPKDQEAPQLSSASRSVRRKHNHPGLLRRVIMAMKYKRQSWAGYAKEIEWPPKGKYGPMYREALLIRLCVEAAKDRADSAMQEIDKAEGMANFYDFRFPEGILIISLLLLLIGQREYLTNVADIVSNWATERAVPSGALPVDKRDVGFTQGLSMGITMGMAISSGLRSQVGYEEKERTSATALNPSRLEELIEKNDTEAQHHDILGYYCACWSNLGNEETICRTNLGKQDVTSCQKFERRNDRRVTVPCIWLPEDPRIIYSDLPWMPSREYGLPHLQVEEFCIFR